MGRKRSPGTNGPKGRAQAEGEGGSQTPHQTIRVETDIARMAAAIVAIEGGTISDLVSPSLRPFLAKRYADVIRKAAEALGPESGAGARPHP